MKNILLDIWYTCATNKGFLKAQLNVRFFQLKDFLINIAEQQINFSDITPLSIDNILIKKYDNNGYCRRSIQGYATVIRSFLRFAEDKGWCQKNLAHSIKAPRVYNMNHFLTRRVGKMLKKS